MKRAWSVLLFIPLVASQGSGEPLIEDPEGDAFERGPRSISAMVRSVCGDTPPATEAYCAAIPDGEGGVPASPAMDIVSVDVEESVSEVAFHLGLASLSGDLSDFMDQEGTGGAVMAILWQSDVCRGGVVLVVDPFGDTIGEYSYHFRRHDDCRPAPADPLQGRCATVNNCLIPVEVEVTPGSPGHLTWRVPRAELWVPAGRNLEIEALTVRSPYATQPGGWVQPGRSLGFGQLDFDGRMYDYQVDWTSTSTFELTHEPASDAWAPVLDVANHGFSDPAPDPRLEVTEIRLHDDPLNFTYEVTLGTLDAGTEWPDSLWQITTPAKHHYIIDIDGLTDAFEVKAIRWLGERAIPIEARAVGTTGSPGTVTVTIPREDLIGTMAGGTIRSFYGSVRDGVRDEDPSSPLGFRYYQVHFAQGNYVVQPPYRFQTDPPAAADLPFIELFDAIGDTETPQDAAVDPAFSESEFDLSHLSVRPTAQDRVELTVAVRDMQEPRVPSLYQASLYGVGVETGSGTFMVALRQARDGTTSAFCGTDRAFLASPAQDPGPDAGNQVPWKLKPGTGDAPAEISFDVPIACFGAAPGVQAVEMRKIAARTAVIGNPADAGTTSITWIDGLDSAEPLSLRLPQPVLAAAEPKSAWAEPFGMSNFWDIFGVIIAALTIAVSIGLVLWRRRKLKQYLREVDEIRRRYVDDAAEMQRQLGALYERLRLALDEGRIPTDHYGIVELRVDKAYVRARLAAFGMNFSDIPHGVVVAAERLVRDGEFSSNDLEITARLMREAKVPVKRQNEVLKVLRAWVTDDEKRTAPRPEARHA